MDKELIKLINKREILSDNIDSLGYQIEELQEEKEYSEEVLRSIEKNIKEMKQKIFKDRVIELREFSEDKFMNDFIKASYCIEKNEDRPILETVKITDSELIALDGIKGVIIKCDSIPDKLKNSFIKWDVREDFENHLNEVQGEFVDVKELLKRESENIKFTVDNLKASTFYKFFKAKYDKEYNTRMVILSYKDFKIVFNKKFLDDILIILGGQQFTASFNNSISPVIIKAENIDILILPMRYDFEARK